jgi:hypothetical protein
MPRVSVAVAVAAVANVPSQNPVEADAGVTTSNAFVMLGGATSVNEFGGMEIGPLPGFKLSAPAAVP